MLVQRSLRFRFCYVPSDRETYFGLIARRNGLIDAAQLRTALDFQEERAELGLPRSLDEVLVDRSLIQSHHRDRIFQAQREARLKDRDAIFAVRIMEDGVAAPVDVRAAMAAQNREDGEGGISLLSILQRGGKIGRAAGVRALGGQIEAYRMGEDERIGSLAVAVGFITPSQWKSAIRDRESRGMTCLERIEDSLIATGAISAGMSSALLRAQKRSELLGEEAQPLVMERRWRDEDEATPERGGSESPTIFAAGDLGLKTARSADCPFCGEAKVEGRRCGACGKEIV